MRFSLVVCTLGRTTQLMELFSSLCRQNRTDFEVILVDQNTDDRLAAIVQEFASVLTINHILHRGKGASSGRNIGINQSRGELIGFPDDDCQYIAGYLNVVHQLFAEDPYIECITGLPTDDEGKMLNLGWNDQKITLDVHTVLNRCQEFTIFIRKRSLGELRFNRYLGVGSGTLWGADEAPDLLIRLIKMDVHVVYFPSLFVYHPNKIVSFDRSVMQRAASYSRGRGCLFRLHRFPILMVFRSVFRPLIGSFVYLLSCSPKRSRYYLTICIGTLRGLLMSKSEIDEVRCGWSAVELPAILPVRLAPLTSKPLVSILIANYNYAKFLPATLQSLVAQTYTDWQAIVCDDGSTDDSVMIIQEYCNKDSRFQLVRKENGGQNSAYNACYRHVEGQVICLLDADDIFTTHKIQRVVDAFLANPLAGMCNHFCQVINAGGIPQTLTMQTFLDSGWLADKALERGACIYVPTTSCISIRREICDNMFPVTPFQERDLDGYLAMICQFLSPICILEEKLAYYRIHGQNMGGITEPTSQRLRYELELIGRRTLNVKEFMKQRFGEETAALIALEDNPQYLQAALKLLAIEGGDHRLFRAHALIQRHPNAKWRAIWYLIFIIPKFLGRRVVPVLHSSYLAKSFIHRLLGWGEVAAT